MLGKLFNPNMRDVDEPSDIDTGSTKAMSNEDYYNYADADSLAFSAMQEGAGDPGVESMMDESAPQNTHMLHTALAAAGMAPGVGIIADMADAALYAMEGDVAGAGLSLISAVPILGLASGSGRIAKGAYDVAKKAPDMSEVNKRMRDIRDMEGMMSARKYDMLGPQKYDKVGDRYLVNPNRGMSKTPINPNRGQIREPELTEAVKEKGRISARYPGIKKLEEQIMRGKQGGVKDDMGTLKKLDNMMGGMKKEMSMIMRVADKTRLDEDSVAALMAFAKGSDALRMAEKSGSFGGQALLDMQAAVARGARIFHSLEGQERNELMNIIQEADAVDTTTIDEQGDSFSATPSMPRQF